jgi:hypothetical protein
MEKKTCKSGANCKCSRANASEWDEIFEEVQTSLHEDVPLRVRNWLKNKFIVQEIGKSDLEKDPVISDDFMIGPDGAYEHIETSWQEIWDHLDAWCQKNDKVPTLKEVMLWMEENYHSPIKILP